jgi:uncharacterized protein with FMN-binding domain
MHCNKYLLNGELMKHCFTFLLLIILAIIFISCSMVLSNINSLNATLPNLSDKPDGVYRGAYTVSPTPVEVKLDVTVISGRLDKIDIVTHTASAIGKQAEKIIPKIIEKQSLDIDVVSGATASSKAILKAVENALQ